MNILSTIVTTVKVLPAKAKFAAVKNAPVLCLGAGLVTIAGGVVLACRATRKADMIIGEAHNFISDAESKIGMPCSDGTTYSEEDYAEDVKNEKIKRNVKVAKAYILSVCVIAAGMGLVCFGHGILAHRYATTVTALNGFLASTTAYRERVREEVGAEKESELYYGSDEGIGLKQDLSYVFDEDSPGASKSNIWNGGYLCKMYNFLYDRFERVGHIFVWDVLSEMGIDETQLDAKDLHIAKTFGWRKGFTEDMNWGVQYEDFVERCEELADMAPVAVVLDFSSARNLLVSDDIWEPFGNVICLT